MSGEIAGQSAAEAGQRRNIILVGMMGTGKSTVGALLAEQLGYELVDLDHIIVESEGRSIADIFAADGETYFRKAESAALQRMLEGQGRIISTGGGAVLAPGNAEMMLDKGLVVALTATEEAIIARVSGDLNRPLLAGNAQDKVRAIMERRREAYRFAHCTVDTSELNAAEVSQHILMHYRG
ncbi:shikimate kinase [Paenibacillus sp. FSL R7-0273]|uniref:shikimate kinase n=1 Tax=Paenibacillus sp. FSL R7-0273 TaxID=1536772 RepID=UPI0004F6C5CF|nr:shikimate kinase [Paenibacillus sp. FSL R7-0273]AIQ46749.1 shikimate kinase [Paenibacillus sp. FSL R7-0273]OMF97482.1 shikimate kinase [Paenibacillus sp. FSL R7-0273]